MQNPFMIRFSGYSMYPFLRPGDRLIVRRPQDSFIEIGDVVVTRNHEHLVAHRLIRLFPDGRGILKGDSLLKPDPDLIVLSDLTGKVEAIIRKNRLINISRGPRSATKKLYAGLSLHNLTYGAYRLRLKLGIKKISSQARTSKSQLEWSAMLLLLKGVTPELQDSLDWQIIKKLANREGISGVLYHYLKKEKIQIPILPNLEKIYQSIAAKNLIYLQRLNEIERALQNEGMQVLVLKGASLLNHFYQGIGMRSMGDLDLMVQPKEKKIFEVLLDRLGYRRDQYIPHLFKKDGVTIDLHFHALNTNRIFSRANLLPLGMKPIWKNTIPLDQGFHQLRRPDDTDNVLILSQHLMKHSFSSLIWIKDIYEILKNLDSKKYKILSERAIQFKQQRCLSYTLYLIKMLFGYDPPGTFKFQENLLNLTVIEKAILDARVKGSSIGRIGPLFSFLCLSGLENRIRYISEAVFPNREVINNEFAVFRGPKRILFYPFRIIQAMIIISKLFTDLLVCTFRGK